MNKVLLENKNIYLRFAEYDDSKDIFTWRNDELTRKSSFNTDEINIKDHERWFKESLANPNRTIFIIVDAQCNKLGQIRFDRKGESAEVAITINPKYRNQGIGSFGLTKAAQCYSNKFFVKRLVGKVKTNNIASLKTFEKAGFKIYKTFEDYIELTYPPI